MVTASQVRMITMPLLILVVSEEDTHSWSSGYNSGSSFVYPQNRRAAGVSMYSLALWENVPSPGKMAMLSLLLSSVILSAKSAPSGSVITSLTFPKCHSFLAG